MSTATANRNLTYRLSGAEIDEISRIAKSESLAYAAKKFMKSASAGVAKAVAESLVESLSDAEIRADGVNPQDLQQYVEGLNMKWEWNTPENTPVSKAVTAVLQPYESSSDQGPDGFPTPTALQVGVGIEF